MPPIAGDPGEFVLRLLLAGAYALIVFLLREAWREMIAFRKEFGKVKEDHGERLTVIETTLQLTPRRRGSDHDGDDQA